MVRSCLPGRRSGFRASAVAVLLFVVLSACAAPPPQATPAPTAAPQGRAVPYDLTLPAGYRVSLYAEGLEELRSITFSPEGVPYVTIMNRATQNGGKIVALPDDDGDGWADRQVLVMSNLDRPHALAFHDGALFASDAGVLYRLRDADGDYVAEIRDRVLVGMPARNDHWSRPFVFDADGMLLVAIGSSCNICQEGDPRRATILRVDPNQLEQRYEDAEIYARGLRSVVDMQYRPGTQELFAPNNSRDYITPEIPPDQLFQIEAGKHYGWPYCYGDRVTDAEVLANADILSPDGSPKDQFCQQQVESPALLLPAHVAPLGLAFYDGAQFPAEMQGRLFLTYHGAFDRSNSFGYRVVSIPFNDGRMGAPQDFLTGFLTADGTDWFGRPVDVAVAPDGSLFVTDDVNGYLLRVEYVGG